MIISLNFNTKQYEADLSKPYDISLPLCDGSNNPSCYYAEPVKFETIVSGDFIGSVKRGGSVNYQKVSLTPHGNGTHTECYGHLSADETATINSLLKSFHFEAALVSVVPNRLENGDQVILLSEVEKKLKWPDLQAVIIRTLPNHQEKKTKQYSGTNPPYLEAALTEYLAEQGVKHLLIDLPSVDREVDGGKLIAHKAFWRMNSALRKHCTITELVFVPDIIEDGLYLLNLQIAPLEMDASPSKPVLYKLKEVSNLT